MFSEYLLTLGQRHISFANVPLNLFEQSSKWRWVIEGGVYQKCTKVQRLVSI